jgi:hypothetical protein
MSPRVDRYGEPIDDEPVERCCWRCGMRVDAARPIPVCDGCVRARILRAERLERRQVLEQRRRIKAKARPDIDSLRRAARRAAEAQGLLWQRPRVRSWWEESTG